MPTTPTCGPGSRNCARTRAWIPTRWRPTPAPGTRSASSPSAWVATKRAGVPEPHPSGRDRRNRSMTSPVADLIGRSHRLGADPRNTNYAGGNTSAKGSATDPVTGQPVDLLWVKGSGGDLGTLAERGPAVLPGGRLAAPRRAHA